jgi:hypothetical protein
MQFLGSGSEGRVYEIAAVSVGTVALLQKTAASFGLVLGIGLLVFLELMQSVGKFALLLVRTVAVFDELFAELRFLLVRRIVGIHLARRLLSGNRVARVFGQLEVSMGQQVLAVHFSHHPCRLGDLLIIKLIIPLFIKI